MKILVLIISLAVIPCTSFAEVPTEAELQVAVKSMKMPRLEARIKAQAAAYRIFREAARRVGFGEQTASVEAKETTVELAALRAR